MEAVIEVHNTLIKVKYGIVFFCTESKLHVVIVLYHKE